MYIAHIGHRIIKKKKKKSSENKEDYVCVRVSIQVTKYLFPVPVLARGRVQFIFHDFVVFVFEVFWIDTTLGKEIHTLIHINPPE